MDKRFNIFLNDFTFICQFENQKQIAQTQYRLIKTVNSVYETDINCSFIFNFYFLANEFVLAEM